MKKNRTNLFVIFLVIFIDLLGFGIIIPLLPDFGKNELLINESLIGIIGGVFSIAQFIFTPVWGSFSDINGRKPILSISLAGNVIAYLMMALVFSGIYKSVLLLFISRIFAGIFSANLSAAQAVISDVTTKEDRAKGMGLIGAAFSLGFVGGPALGGLLSMHYGHGMPIFLSAMLSLIALLLCVSSFKETLPPDLRVKRKFDLSAAKIINLKAVNDILKKKDVALYILIFFIFTFSYANIHVTFQLFAERKEGLDMNRLEVGLMLSYIGLISSIVQFFLIKYFKKYLGEKQSLPLAGFLLAAGLLIIPFTEKTGTLLGAISLLAFGSGLIIPMLLGLISKNTSRAEQGSVLGINQSFSSLARGAGPIWGGFIYQSIGYQFPFLSGGFFMLLVIMISFYLLFRYRVSDQ